MSARISTQQITDYIDAVRASGALGKGERRLRLLEHLIRAEAAGEGRNLKAYSIGLDVFDRAETFDPSSDSIVRVEIGRLRTGIALFEASEHANTALLVEIPVGTYQPKLLHRNPAEEPGADIRPDQVHPPTRPFRQMAIVAVLLLLAAASLVAFMWPREAQITTPASAAITVLVRDFEGDVRMAKRTQGIISRSLVRSKIFNVLDDVPLNLLNGQVGSSYVLSGHVYQNSTNGYDLEVDLVDAQTAQIVWSKSQAIYSDDQIDDTVESLFGSELRVRLFSATKRTLEERDVKDLTPDELFVMATWVPGVATNAVEWEQERIELMQLVLKKDHDFGDAHSVIADKLRYLANVYEPADTEAAATAAQHHIQRARELSPLNADAMFNVAQALWHGGEVSESIMVMQRVLELNKGHQLAEFLHQVIPYTCAVPPQSVVADAIAFDAALATDNPIRWLTLTWIAWLHANQQNYDTALDYEEQAALIFQIPYTFMRQAMILNELGRSDEAKAVLENQRNNWPNISARFFANVTYPRLCSENADPQIFIEPYVRLADMLDTQE